MLPFRAFITEGPSHPDAQLFHKDLGIPPSLLKSLAGLPVTYGYHAKQAAADDGLYTLPTRVPQMYSVVEVESVKGRPTKWVIRFPIPNTVDDMVMVVQPDGFVRTVWVNKQNDHHKTLKKWLYTTPDKFKAH